MTFTISKTKLAIAVIAVAMIIPTSAMAFHVFDDVPDDKFYAEPVEWAFDNGITTGKSADLFAPDDAVTRGESVTFLKRYNDNVVEPAIEGVQADADANAGAIATNTGDIATNTAAIDALEAITPLYAHVDASATPSITLGRGAEAVNYESLGDYTVEFDRDVDTCAFSGVTGWAVGGTPSDGSTINVSAYPTDPNAVWVEVFDASGSEVDEDFYIILMCPPEGAIELLNVDPAADDAGQEGDGFGN